MTQDRFGTTLTPLGGGYSGETFLVGEGAEKVVVRIYRRRPERAVVDASLLRLVRGILPVPEVFELRPATADLPAVLVTEYVDGVSLDRVLRDDPPVIDLETLGCHLGQVLGSLSAIPFLTAGMFVDADLGVSAEGMPVDLGAWAQHYRDTGRLAAWAEADWRALQRLTDLAADTMSDGPNPPRTVLAHSDFNPKNILVDPADGRVAGLLDWEFAHAGSPYADLGNLTRFERHPAFIDAAVTTLVEHAPVLADDPLSMGRAADMWALLELAGGSPTNPVRELAGQLLLAQARAGDLAAWPWDTPRVDPMGQSAVS